MHVKWVAKQMRASASAILLVMLSFDAAHPQWVQPRGEGSFSLSYQRVSNTEHLWSELGKARGFPRQSHDDTEISGNILVVNLDYAVYDRLALNITLPFINTSLESGNVEPGSHSVDSQGVSAFQDLSVNLRYMALLRPLIITPFVGFSWPTHDYGTHGHAAIGRKLKTFSFGLGLGRMLSPVLSSVYLQGGYTFTLTEKVAGIDTNNSVFSVGATYFTPFDPLTLSTYFNRQFTHGGIDWSDPGFNTNDWFPIHDRIAAEKVGMVGGNVAYALSDRVGVYAGYFRTIRGLSANTQQTQGVDFGTSTSF